MLEITSPQEHQVFQRRSKTQGVVVVAGRSGRGSGVACRVGDGAWIEAPIDPRTRAFEAQVPCSAGGWFPVQVRVTDNGDVAAESRIERVGVGEVFVVAGQSNSANFGSGRRQTASGRCASFDGTTWALGNDPQRGGGGGGGSFMPAFGDALVARYDVPVAVACCGIGSTSVRNWLPAGEAMPLPPKSGTFIKPAGEGRWVCTGQAHDMLSKRMQSLGGHGFRAVLWHQGESDSFQEPGHDITAADYRRMMELVIRTARQRAGWEVPWFTANVSYRSEGQPENAPLRAAQQSLWADGVALEGPDTDKLRREYRAGVHFNPQGLDAHGKLWAEKVSAWLDGVLAVPVSAPPSPTPPIGQPIQQPTERSTAAADPQRIIAALSAGRYDDAEARERAVVEAALADLAAVSRSPSPMTGWTAQLLLKAGRTEEGLAIVRAYMAARVKEAKARIANFEQRRKSADHKPFLLPNGREWGEPHVNGFGMWSMINVYLRYHDRMDEQLKADFQWLFTSNTSWAGSTGNLSFLIPVNLYLTEHAWDPALLPEDGRYGARGAAALRMFEKRISYTARRGSPEFGSRPYLLYNIGPLLSFDNAFTEPELARRARMAYEMSIAHAAGTWLNGNWATPAGRSYPAYTTQAPNGCADMLWAYFGGKTPKLGGATTAVFAVAEPWRPHPLIVKAATDRARAYVHRSRFDGERLFQTSFVNRTYALFSTAVTHPPTGRKTGIWGQTYPYGVMFDQPDADKASICWMTVPCCDDQPLTNHTQGVSSRFAEYLQHRGSLLLVANDLTNQEFRPQVRKDVKGHKPFTTDAWYVLAYVPHGYRAMINDSRQSGRVFLDYGSVLIAISASQPFDWDPAARVFAGKGGFHPADSEFRVFGGNVAVAMETALPDEFSGDSPADRLAAFKAAIAGSTRISVENVTAGQAVVAKGTYVDRFGATLEKTFQGDALIDGRPVDYASWPLVDNPWIHQDWDGDMRISDGRTTRVYDVTNWTITERAAE